MLPALFSYAKDGACTVASQLCNNTWCIQLHPNLSATAAHELQMLHSFLPQPPTDAAVSGSDVRVSAIHHKPLTTSQVYQLSTFRGVACEFSSWIWDKIIPLRYRVFLWLAFWGRLNTRDNMIRKHWSLLTEHQDCDICPASESASHIVLRCFPASVIWATFHMNDLASSSTDIVHFMHRAQQAWINSRGVHILFAAAAVTLWHARNDRIFNNKRWPPSYLRRYMSQLLQAWQHRAK